MFGLTSQIRRGANSIGANIAEGCGRRSDTDFARFLQMALGSASELEHHLLLAHDLQLIDAASNRRFDNEVTGVKKMLTALIQKTRPRPIADSQQPRAKIQTAN
jgi:four helix bundle protein